LLPRGAIDELPHLLQIWQDLKANSTMYRKDLLKDWLLDHLKDYIWYIEYPQDCTPTSEVVFKESHELVFQEKLKSFGGSNVQASNKKSITKGKGEKTILQEIVELPNDVIMVDYQVTILKRDFDDLLEGIDKRSSSRRLNMSQESHQPSSFWPDFSFKASKRTLGFDSPRGCQALSSERDLFLV
jgi:hypothetical protein